MAKVVVLIASLLFAPAVWASTELYDAAALRAHFGLTEYPASSRLSQLRIAVLDNGFQGYNAGSGQLPASAELVERYPDADGNTLEPSPHGLYMAQVIWAMTGKLADGPKFYLLNASGMTNLRAAVRFAVEHKVDIVLYSQNWEYGGNFDGRGFINRAVDEATSQGILWVNAAGNYGGRVYNGAVPVTGTGEPRCLHVRNAYDSNRVTVTLSWNDFQDSEAYQTQKDLDLFVYDASGKLVGSSERAQVSLGRGDARAPSHHARELTTLTLDRGDYCLKIRNMSGNIDAARDRVRVSVMTENKPDNSLDFLDHTDGGEIMVPADNPHVLTIGNTEPRSASGPTVDGRSKPDFRLDVSEARFTDGFISSGTSNSAALFAGILAVLKGEKPSLTRDSLVASATHATPALYRGSVARLANPETRLMRARYGVSFEDLLGVVVEDGRRVLYVDRHPAALGSVFSSALAPFLQSGADLGSLRYFVSLDAGGSWLEARVISNKTVPPSGGGWLELRTPGSARSSSTAPLWVTPRPDELGN